MISSKNITLNFHDCSIQLSTHTLQNYPVNVLVGFVRQAFVNLFSENFWEALSHRQISCITDFVRLFLETGRQSPNYTRNAIMC